jgi:hypothetical protein
MWSRLRRRRQPPPVFASALDRLTELIESVVALLDEVTLTPAAEPAPEPPSNPAAPPTAPSQSEPAPAVPEPWAEPGYVVFVSSPDGYRLLQRDGPVPDRGTALELDDGVHLVLRLGTSPLPGDRRRCAFVEREEPAAAERNDDR